jgi:nucleoid-associated protein YgaU
MTSEFDRLFAVAVGALFTAYLLRCFLGGLLLGAARIPGRVGQVCNYWGEAVTPKLARRVAVGFFGALTAFTGVSPALAVNSTPPPTQTPIPGGNHSHVDIPDLDRGPGANKSTVKPPEAAKTRTPAAVSPSESSDPATIRVRAGDCLWLLAAKQLGSKTSDSDIAKQTKRWYSVNRSAIGSDPDVITVGSILTVPSDAR